MLKINSTLSNFCVIILWFVYLLGVESYNIVKTRENTKLVPNVEHSAVKLSELSHHVFIYKLFNKKMERYRSFCAGSIIGDRRVLTSANCFLTNRKRYKHHLKDMLLGGGILHTLTEKPRNNKVEQWRSITKLYSQKLLKYPAHNIGLLETNESWIFNKYVNKIPYSKWNQDFDGICYGTAVEATKSWANNKELFIQKYQMIVRNNCERMLLKSCRIYYCTAYNKRTGIYSLETQGAGLICFGTGDPNEKENGVLVGVMSFMNIGLPSLHNRVGLFYKWVTDRGCINGCNLLDTTIMIIVCLFFINKM